ncbi:MAG TPA: response regulator [Candidatus Gastranaerophilales bacterium]|nr:response regulator [Candidatus Gastranaerophilales bacterium]
MPHVLIVEDDRLNYELAAELLEFAGYSTAKAENLDECLNEINTKKPDLILMDMELPEIKGHEITKLLKDNSNFKDIPIIALTARVMEKDVEKAFSAGCSGFISKPFNVSTFASIINNFINPEKQEYFYNKNIKYSKNAIIADQKEFYTKKYRKHNILVVDDNQMNAEILKETLEQLGQNVKILYHGRNVLETIEKEQIDLVLLDIMMPEISGYDIIKQIKATPATQDLPVIFVSALDSARDIVKGFDLGSYEYIVKPYKLEEVKARVLSILKIKDLQDQLKSEKKILDLIFEFSEDGMILLNFNFEIISCNNRFLKWIEKDKESVLNKNLYEVLSFENNLKDFCDLYSYFDFEIQNNENKKKRRFIEANCSRIPTLSEKEEGGYVMILRDITAKKEIEAQKETFVATLTHDLKTPVRAQITALELVLKGKFGEINKNQNEILSETLNSNKYMFSMLDNLLSTYKYENGNIIIKKQDTNINELIKSCYSELKHLIEEKKHVIDFKFEHETLNAFIDPLEIKRVILNLISNAINYTDERGKIIISTKKEKGNTVVSFIDNGKGMSEAEQALLFSKFTSYSKKFRQVGTGLGLYLSKQIIETHGGEIFVKSEEGKGSCFTFHIP